MNDHKLAAQTAIKKTDTVVSSSHKLISVAVLGYTGRMGQAVLEELSKHTRFHQTIPIGRDLFNEPQKLLKQLQTCQAIIDFTTVNTQQKLYQMLLDAQLTLPMITGVTGLADPDQYLLETYARQAPVFQAANFSIGVALLKKMSVMASQVLGDEFDIEIFELHHRHKLDAPSGTALVLAEALKQQKQTVNGKHSSVETTLNYPRNPAEIHVTAGRGGGVFGDHTIFFLGQHERLELKHSALNRSLFAAGALRAVQWCVGRSPGLYHMDHLWEA